MADLAIALEISGRDVGASASADKVAGSLRNVGTAADDATKRSSGFAGALGHVASIAGGFIVAQGLMQLPGLLSNAAKAAAEEETGIARLATAVDNAGGSWASQSQEIENVIHSREMLGFSDDKLRSSLSMLTAQTGSVDEAFKRQALAMDLARGTGMDLETASRLLGKVTDENVTALNRYGISVEKGASQTELFAKVQERFGGQSEAAAQTAAVQWEIFQNQLGNLQEDIGGALLPVMTQLGGAAVSFVEDLRQSGTLEVIVAGLGTAFSAMGSLAATAFGIIRAAVSSDLFQGLLDAATTVGAEVLNVFDILAGALSALFAGDFIVAIQVLEDAFNVDLSPLVAVYDIIVGTIIPGIQAAFTAAGPIIDAAIQFVVTTVLPALQVGVQTAFDFITGTALPFLQSAFETVFPMIQTVVETVLNTVVPFVVAQFQVISDWTAENWPLIQQTIETVWNAIQAVINAIVPPIVQLVTDNWSTIERVTTSVWTIISTVIDTTLQTILGLIRAGMQLINGDWEGAWQTLVGVAERIFRGLITILGEIGGLIGEALRSAMEAGRQAIAGFADGFMTAGRSLIDGIIRGFADASGRIQAALNQAATQAFDGFKRAWGISSPSTRAEAEIGVPLGEGIINGLVTAFGQGDSRIAEGIRAVVTTAIRVGIDPLIAASLAKAESGFNPAAVGDAGASVGLFQLHERGQGAGMGAARLDPWVNAVKFLEQHKGLFDELASKLEGVQLATIFGGRAEVSDPQYWHRYGEAFREIVAALGPLGNLSALASQGVQALVQTFDQVDPKAAELARIQTELNAAIGQGFPQASGAGAQALQAFGAGAQPVLDAFLAGNATLGETQLAITQLAAEAGLATEPMALLETGAINQEQALRTVLAAAAEVNPAYASTAAGFIMGATTSADATLNFLHLAASTQGVTDAVVPADQAIRTMAGFMPNLSRLAVEGALSGDDLTRAILGLTESSGFARTNLDLQTASTDELNQALEGIVDELAIVDPRFQDLNQRIKDNGGITDETRGQLVNLIDTIDDVPGVVDPASTSIEGMGTASQTAAEVNKESWEDILSEIRSAVREMVEAIKDGVQDIVNKLDEISDAKVTIDARGAIRELGKLEDAADDARRAVDKVADDVGKGFKFVSGRQYGGWADIGTVGWVGESGPELSVSRGDYILTNAEAKAIARDAFASRSGRPVVQRAGGTVVEATFINHGTLVAQDADDWLVNSLKRLEREGRIEGVEVG